MKLSTAVLGGAPGDSLGDKLKLSALRAFRTFLQGVAAAFPAGGAGAAIPAPATGRRSAWAVLGAGITAIASLLQNVASNLSRGPDAESD